MDERNNQDILDLENPAPTGSWSTRRPQRRRTWLSRVELLRDPGRTSPGTDQNWKCPSRIQDEICPCRHRTPEVPGPRRRNEAPCHGMPTRVGLGSIPRKTRANRRRQPEQDHLTSALADHQLRLFPDHGVRSHDQAPTRIGSARAGPKMRSALADDQLRRFSTTYRDPMTGHQPELEVPRKDTRLDCAHPTIFEQTTTPRRQEQMPSSERPDEYTEHPRPRQPRDA
ncbi:hypothetical protein TIFTF001_054439 [Ficus carica]|uniref:Uncharacterized protein n=1 Tax=Ficus carica TaxID=3494 RepID=A0AA88EGZ4_FICCA|nr:hypothetical protein TIFTF001_054439 [Ficus carica]